MRKKLELDDEKDVANVNSEENKDDMLVFSDDLEVPAFIRNRNLNGR